MTEEQETGAYHNPKEEPARMMARTAQVGGLALIGFFMFGVYVVLKPQVGAPLAAGMVLFSGLAAAYISHTTGPDTHE